jgi:hypothetical protein
MNGPRITPLDIEQNIRSEHYFTAYEGVLGERFHHEREDDDSNEPEIPDTLRLLTICLLSLKNGWTVVGTSACAYPENFDKEMGQKAARQNAFDQIWPLMGYELKTQIHEGYYDLKDAEASDRSSDKTVSVSEPAPVESEGHDAVGTGEAETHLAEYLESTATSNENPFDNEKI